MKNDYRQKFVSEYNPGNGNFHIQTLVETLEGNFQAAMEGRAHTYLIIGVYDSQDEAFTACDVFANRLKAAGKKVAI